MNNPDIRKRIAEMLESMLGPSVNVLGDALKANKRRAFVTKAGEILYGEPEVDHRVRLVAASRILDRYQRASADDSGADERVVDGGSNVVELCALRERKADADRAADGTLHVVGDLDADDRDLLEQVAEIDAELAALDTDSDEADGDQ